MKCQTHDSLTSCENCRGVTSILELQLRKSVELTKRPIDAPDYDEESDALKRLKKLLADTREMIAQAERLVASIRDPRDYFAQADGG